MSRPNMLYADGHIGPMDDEAYAQWQIDVATSMQAAPEDQTNAMLQREYDRLSRSDDTADQIAALQLRLDLAGIPK